MLRQYHNYGPANKSQVAETCDDINNPQISINGLLVAFRIWPRSARILEAYEQYQ